MTPPPRAQCASPGTYLSGVQWLKIVATTCTITVPSLMLLPQRAQFSYFLHHMAGLLLKWFGISLVFIYYKTEHYMAAWRYEMSSRFKKIFHSFAALTCEIFFNNRREILYLRATIKYLLCSSHY